MIVVVPQTSPISERERLERQAVAVDAVGRPGVVAGVRAEDPAADPDEHQPADRIGGAAAREQETDGGEAAEDRVGRAVAAERELVPQRQDRQQRHHQHEHDHGEDARARRRRPPRRRLLTLSPDLRHTGNVEPRAFRERYAPSPRRSRPGPRCAPVAFWACASRPGTSTRSSSACRACCRGSTSAVPTSSACRRPSWPTAPSTQLLARGARAPRLRGRAPRRGAVERRRDPLSRRPRRRHGRGSPARPGFPHAEARAVAATCGGIRDPLRVRPQRAHPGLRALPLQARVARGARGDGRTPARRRRSCAAT